MKINLSKSIQLKELCKISAIGNTRYKAKRIEFTFRYDVDHIIDLQLGGADDILNMAPLDRSLGAQIQHAIEQYPVGTRLRNFTIS